MEKQGKANNIYRVDSNFNCGLYSSKRPEQKNLLTKSQQLVYMLRKQEKPKR